MTSRVLVVSSVHPSDDPRIRYKYIPSLATEFDVVYATKAPAPSDVDGLVWRELRGGRVSRWFRSLWLMLGTRTEIIAIHDPELIPAALLVRLMRRRTIVFDLHEDLPAQIAKKSAVPVLLRRPTAAFSVFWLKLAERFLHVTLAEDGYQHLFGSELPVFRNYPISHAMPAVDMGPRVGVVYVGDVTRQRGALTLVSAAAIAGVGPVTYVGRCADDLAAELSTTAEELGVVIELMGWQPYPLAMRIASRARVGVSPLHDIPNYRHSLPTKTLEYLALGTPVVASNLPGTADVIGHLPGVVLCTPGSVEDLARALGAVDSRLVTSAQSGAAAVRGTYSWPTEDVAAYYVSLVGR